MKRLIAALLGSMIACTVGDAPAWAQADKTAPAQVAPTQAPPTQAPPATPDSDQPQTVHVPANFWGIELRTRSPFTGHPDIFALWRMSDGSLAVGIFWRNEGVPKPAAASIINLTNGMPAVPDSEAWRAANDQDEMAKLEARYKMTFFLPAKTELRLPGRGPTFKMIEDKAKECRAPFFDSLAGPSQRIAVFKPFSRPHRFDLAGCGSGLAGDALALYKTIYLVMVPVDDGTFLGLEINFPEADDTPTTLIVRFRPNLTSPFFDRPSDYIRVDYPRIARFVEAGFRANPQQAILDMQQAVTAAQPKRN